MSTLETDGSLRRSIRLLYHGRSRRAAAFRYALVVFDVTTIVYFLITVAAEHQQFLGGVNFAIGVLVLTDFAARIWVAENRKETLFRVYTIADIIVVLSLFLAPLFEENLAILRVLRGLRLIHSYRLLHDLRRDVAFFRVHEDAIFAAVNLFVFVIVATSIVYVVRFGEETSIENYIDALYFTVATLTTTGFGDITLSTPGGKVLSVFIMIFGVALFVRLARAIFQPPKVKYDCPECKLSRHDPDAVHCKHCGEPLKIETAGVE
ncbi:MAG: ion channel [Gammaproteobacteria bacterium]|jgi:voltage-gated potassium channel|nr:ion channel [Gammaproteobacteria bacterium]